MTALKKQNGIKGKDLEPAANKFLENLEIKVSGIVHSLIQIIIIMHFTF